MSGRWVFKLVQRHNLIFRTTSQRKLRLFSSFIFILAASSKSHSQSSSSHPHVSPTLKSSDSNRSRHDHASAALRAHAGSGDIELEPLHPGSAQEKEAQQCPRKQFPYSQAGHQQKRSQPTKEAMKFSHSIQFNAVPDWSSHYINYSNLKKLWVLRRISALSSFALKPVLFHI